MIKRIIGPDMKTPGADEHWLDLDSLAQVEVSSEDTAHPIEAALRPQAELGWEAAESGPQVLRLLFDQPQPIKEIYLEFLEFKAARTQEFVLQWSSDSGRSYRDVVRQQYNFSPPNTTAEREAYSVNLESVTNIELRIVPDISGGHARAALKQFRIR